MPNLFGDLKRKNMAMNRAEKALELFHDGYNCSQSVLTAFADTVGLSTENALSISAGLGGGVGRMREVCGAVSASAMVLGALFSGEDSRDKATAYKKVREFSAEFSKRHGTVICRELLGLSAAERSSVPEERNETYYATRPCEKAVFDAAGILEKMIAEKEE